MTGKPRSGRRTRRGLTATALTAGLAAVSVVGAGVVPANAEDATGPTYSGAVRSYGAYAAGDVIFGFLSARANISESVAIADTDGLSKYGGTGAGDYGLPWNVTRDYAARSYARATPIGVGKMGLVATPVAAESLSTTITEGGDKQSPFGTVDLGNLGSVNVGSGNASSYWDSSQKGGGVLAEASQTTGALTVLPKVALPGFSAVLPLVGADLGLTSAKVELVPMCPCTTNAQMAVRSSSQWTFVDAQLLGNLLRVSWSGSRDTAPTLVASANGRNGGAKVEELVMPTMSLSIGKVPITIAPNTALDFNKILPPEISRIVSGSVAYGGLTNVYEAHDGTEARASMNGLTASIHLLKVLPFLPALGNGEAGFMRSDVSAKMQKGGFVLPASAVKAAEEARAAAAAAKK